jgi:hypothetical protein
MERLHIDSVLDIIKVVYGYECEVLPDTKGEAGLVMRLCRGSRQRNAFLGQSWE